MHKSIFNKKVTLMAMMAMTAFITKASYADEQSVDVYGNVIDWDINENSDKTDNAGLEKINDNYVFEEYSPEEQKKILQQMAEAETEAPSERGWITVSLGEVPEDWSKNNIKIVLYRENAKETFFLHRQLNWQTSTQLPIGHYTVYKAETINGIEKFHADISTFDITENENMNIILSYGDAEIIEPTIPENLNNLATDENTGGSTYITSEKQQENNNAEENKETEHKSWIYAILAVIALVIAIGSGIYFLIFRSAERAGY